ncbi:MAG: efflux RND transporter periplasmic adaptor subunit [Metallibacterium scheffleri]|jgi:Cu(I)/Ag(I) efflux system membrane fusion protein|uniref:efflux RND transporter periplasmic adaptor subunit n=1 Tax=Metallibacterium scheffleri TaxID=993689 RepID=UPI0026EFBDF4|nr:efflux RND transporter periplasmic adaptor subunit [Metallibacterium scheffleri]MCK9367311.1 efflux RND transporter periplasmic adaptor subunit [Metallibacterium scheffleri]
MGVAAAAGYVLGTRDHGSAAPTSGAQPARKVLYWYDPMQPGTHFNHPGPSPLMPGMQLVPKYAGGSGTSMGLVRISPVVEQNLGMRTSVIRVGVLHRELRVPGVLAWDRRRSVVVSARTDGVLSRLFVRAPFDHVRAGQPLAELLAPAWMSAVAEYRALEHAQSADARALRSAALQRLYVLGMSAQEIRSADISAGGGIMLRAPASGVVSALDVRQGQQVAAGTTLLRIDDLARLWLDAAIPQAEVAGIGPGTPVAIEVDAFPGRIFAGNVEALLPEVDARTRTETARIALDNPHGTLAPGMYATVRLATAGTTPHPLVPDEALISTGVQNRVLLDLGDGRMQPRAVRIGRSADGYTEVLAGLKGGERVVTSGQFLIDSEANLNGALQRLTTPPAPRSSAAPDVPAVPVMPASSAPTVPARPSVKPPAQDAMPGMAMPASTKGHTP